jgi:hypothetical protein
LPEGKNRFNEPFKPETILGQSWTVSGRGLKWAKRYRRVLFVPRNQEMLVERSTLALIRGLLEFEKAEHSFSIILFPLKKAEVTLRFGRDYRRY